MIVAIGYLSFKPGTESKGLDILMENSALGAEQKGCLEATVLQSTEDASEIILFSKWEDDICYTNAITKLKQHATARKLFLKVLPYLNKQPQYKTYRIVTS